MNTNEEITQAAKEHYPNGYRMKINTKIEWSVITKCLLELTDRSFFDDTTGKVKIHPEDMSSAVYCLQKANNECADNMRYGILYTLGLDGMV